MRETLLGSMGADDTEYKLIIINLEQKRLQVLKACAALPKPIITDFYPEVCVTKCCHGLDGYHGLLGLSSPTFIYLLLKAVRISRLLCYVYNIFER